MVARDILLAEHTGGHIHLCHMSTRGSVELIRRAKEKGIRVTAEACPHHFTLTHEACEGYNTNAKMNPPLREPEDREAIRQGLREGVDRRDLHRPRAASLRRQGAGVRRRAQRDHRAGDRPRPGHHRVGGAGTSDAVVIWSSRMSTMPGRIFNLPGRHPGSRSPADVLVADPKARVDRRSGGILLQEPKHTLCRPAADRPSGGHHRERSGCIRAGTAGRARRGVRQCGLSGRPDRMRLCISSSTYGWKAWSTAAHRRRRAAPGRVDQLTPDQIDALERMRGTLPMPKPTTDTEVTIEALLEQRSQYEEWILVSIPRATRPLQPCANACVATIEARLESVMEQLRGRSAGDQRGAGAAARIPSRARSRAASGRRSSRRGRGAAHRRRVHRGRVAAPQRSKPQEHRTAPRQIARDRCGDHPADRGTGQISGPAQGPRAPPPPPPAPPARTTRPEIIEQSPFVTQLAESQTSFRPAPARSQPQPPGDELAFLKSVSDEPQPAGSPAQQPGHAGTDSTSRSPSSRGCAASPGEGGLGCGEDPQVWGMRNAQPADGVVL